MPTTPFHRRAIGRMFLERHRPSRNGHSEAAAELLKRAVDLIELEAEWEVDSEMPWLARMYAETMFHVELGDSR